MIAEEAVQQQSLRKQEGSASSAAQPWRIGIALSVLLAACFALLWPTTASFIEQWTNESNETYTHGSLITAIAFWLIFRNRYKYRSDQAHLNVWGLAGLIALGLVWLVTVRAGIKTGHQLLFPCIAWLSVCAVFGWRFAISVAFPFGFLLLQTTIWDAVNPVLQAVTVVVTEFLLDLTAVPAYVEGNLIHLAVGTFEVAGGCSGLHFFIVALALGALYGELEDASFKGRVQLVAIAVGMGMIANWLRVYVIVLAGHLTNMQHYLITVEHYWFGWGVFAVTMIAFFIIARRMTLRAREPVQEAELSAAPASYLPYAITVTLVALSVPFWWSIVVPVSAAEKSVSLFAMPVQGWDGPSVAPSGLDPSFDAADQVESAVYRRGEVEILVHVITYLAQSQGRELTDSRNQVVESSNTSVTHSEAATAWPATELLVDTAHGSKALIQYGYRIGSLRTRSGALAQLSYGVKSLFGPSTSHAIVLRMSCHAASCGPARASMSEFAQKFPLISGE